MTRGEEDEEEQNREHSKFCFFNYQYDRILCSGLQLFGKQIEETSLYNPHLLVLGQGHGQALEDDLLSRKNRS